MTGECERLNVMSDDRIRAVDDIMIGPEPSVRVLRKIVAGTHTSIDKLASVRRAGIVAQFGFEFTTKRTSLQFGLGEAAADTIPSMA
jgi:hypothetical protein